MKKLTNSQQLMERTQILLGIWYYLTAFDTV